ncbi:MAG: amidophosphoribosyltransferase, partial [Dehalococcoidia bacterium]|nr:amidophosphoribosyltransferase [Dehalococcoidia bacterium]
MCGFIGVIHSGSGDVVPLLYDGLMALQHRGQDSAGIMTFDGRFHTKKGQGLVRDFIEPRHFERLRGDMGLAHVRYPTIGSNTEVDAQPFEVYYPYGIAMAHNGNVANYHRLLKEIRDDYGRHVNSSCDVEVILNVFAHKLASMGALNEEAVCEAVRFVFEKVKGAYSCI